MILAQDSTDPLTVRDESLWIGIESNAVATNGNLNATCTRTTYPTNAAASELLDSFRQNVD